MKKLFLSLSVIVSFLLYSAIKEENSSVVAVNRPISLTPTMGISPTLAPPTPGSKNIPINNPTPIDTLPPPTSAPVPASNGRYKDGTYTGDVADAFYGNIQVQAVVSGGKLTDIVFLQYPNDRQTSIEINSQAMPFLKSEAIAAQSAIVDGVSGATDSSRAFIQSLGSALAKAS